MFMKFFALSLLLAHSVLSAQPLCGHELEGSLEQLIDVAW